MDLHRPCDLEPDGQDGVEGSRGLLEDHGDVPASDLVHLLVVFLEEVRSLEDDLAFDGSSGRRHQAHDGQSACPLAAAAFANYGQRFAPADAVRDTVDGLDDSALREEVRSRSRSSSSLATAVSRSFR